MYKTKIQTTDFLVEIQLFSLPIKVNPSLPCQILHTVDKADSVYVLTFRNAATFEPKSEVYLYSSATYTELELFYLGANRFMVSTLPEVYFIDASNGKQLGYYWLDSTDHTIILDESVIFVHSIESICVDFHGLEIWRQDYPGMLVDFALDRRQERLVITCDDGQKVHIDVASGKGFIK